MPSIGDRATASAEKRVQDRLVRIYSKAQKEMAEQMKEFNTRFAQKDQEKRARVKSGQMTQEDYDKWKRMQVLQSDIWRQKVEQATKTLEDANRQALRVINGEKMDVFAENANYEAYRLSKDTGIGYGFSVYDKDTVGKLIREQPELMPRKVVNGKKDRAWNRTKIADAVSQSIIEGDSLPEMTARIARETAHENDTTMARYAATAMTSAQNAGRMETMERAKGMGIKVKKKWIATLDARTRDSHAELDGQVVDIDQPFITHNRDGSLAEIMFPGDPTADGEQVWNCRCTLGYVYEEYPDAEDAERIAAEYYRDEDDNLRSRPSYVSGMSYKEWKQSAQIPPKQKTTQEESQLEKKLKNPVNRFGERIAYSEKIADKQKQFIENLTSEFDTKLKEVKTGAQHAAGSVEVSGTIMRVSTKSEADAAHEFAHSISIQNQTKFGLYDEKDFWKEIQKVRTEYRKAVGDDTTKWISAYEHSSKDLDEFFAEAFTLAIMSEKGLEIPDKYGNDLTYANEVLRIAKKYFGKKR